MMWSLTGTKLLLFLASPSTNFSVRDMRNHFQWQTTGWESSVFETKIDPKGRGRGKKGVCTSLKRFPERGKKRDCFFCKWATTERFQLPVTCRGPQKTQPASKPLGTSKDFPCLEMDWRWTDTCKERVPTLRQKLAQDKQGLYTAKAKSAGSPAYHPTVTGMTVSWQIYELSHTQKSGRLDQGSSQIFRNPCLHSTRIRSYRQNTYLSDPHLQ